MGESIAQFRDMALAIRRTCDEAIIHPPHLLLLSIANPLQATAAVERLKAGKMSALKFAELLRQSGGLPGVPDIAGLGYFDAARRQILARGPQRPEFERAYSRAVREAARHADLLDVVERRLHSLLLATTALADLAGDSSSSRHIEHKRKYASQLERWHEAYEALLAFIEEPPAPAASSEKKTGSKQKKRRDRKGIGGRPEKFTMKFIREVVAAHERDQRHARTSRRPLPPIPEWLSGYCSEKGINIRDRFPPRSEGEAWSVTANRFWKAAKKRLREAETNCH